MKYRIYIPTIGRKHISTIDSIPKSEMKSVIIVSSDGAADKVRGAQYLHYKKTGIHKTRQFILDHARKSKLDCVIMLDDDIRFCREEDGKIVAYPGGGWLPHMVTMLRSNALVSLASRFMQQGKPREIKMYGACGCAVGFNLSYDLNYHSRMKQYEDTYITLQALSNRMPVAVSNKFMHAQALGSDAEGGCSVYIDEHRRMQSVESLERQFSKYVRMFTNKKGRVTCRVEWKKCHKDNS